MKSRILKAAAIALAGIAVLIGCSIFGLWPLLFHWFAPWFKGSLEHAAGRVISVFLFLGIAFGLFCFRQNERIGYGISEIIAGAASCWFAVSATDPTSTSAALSIGGGVYVMVRGMTNVQEGIAKDKIVIVPANPN